MQILAKVLLFFTHAFCEVTSKLFFFSQLYKFTLLLPYLSATKAFVEPFRNNATSSFLNSSSFDLPDPLGLLCLTPLALKCREIKETGGSY
jgi:hypothetical protein